MRTVLLVDDDPDLLELLSYHFEQAGFTVLTAATGIEGLHEARRRLPQIIVLDVFLPDLDGLTVCEILRHQPSTACIPVLMLTALGGQLSKLAGLESGANDYVVKPVHPRDLVQRVTELLGQNPSGLDHAPASMY
jgi:two-component system phosphate regulon response regulator PhoB